MELYIITIVSSADLRCVKVEVAALSSLSLISFMVCVVVKRHSKK